MSSLANTVRLYTSDDSFTRLKNVPSWVKEVQVALAFARDYDSHGKPTTGKFRAYWDPKKVTPSVISDFKSQIHPFKVKFLLTIGGRDSRYPFSVHPDDRSSWLLNANQSLKDIISHYNLDGVDIYYEHITSDGFVDIMGQLIAKLKQNKVTTVASIAPSAPLNTSYYQPLYQQHQDDIDTVVYQCHTEVDSITTIRGLKHVFDNIATTYTNEKLLAGYSTLSRDWSTVSVPLYFATVGQLVLDKKVSGTSVWTVSDESGTTDSTTSFDPQWVPELVSLVINNEL